MPTFPGRAGEGRAAVDSSRRRGPARRAPSHLTRTQLLVGAGILVALWLLSHALTSVLEPGPWMQHARDPGGDSSSYSGGPAGDLVAVAHLRGGCGMCGCVGHLHLFDG